MPGTKETREEFEARIEDWKAYVSAKKTRRDPSVFESFKEDMVDAPVIDESKSALFGGGEDPVVHGSLGAVQPGLGPPLQPQSHQSLFDESEGSSDATQHRPAPFWLPADHLPEEDIPTRGPAPPDGPPSDQACVQEAVPQGSLDRCDQEIAGAERASEESEEKENLSNSHVACGGPARPGGTGADAQKPAGDAVSSLQIKNSSLCDNTYVIKTRSEVSEKQDEETHRPSFRSEDSTRRTSRYMNGTIPFDASQEAVGHLEAKLRLQNVQIENYKEAIRKKDDAIELLRQEILLLRSSTNDIDYEFVRSFSERGLEIVEDLIQRPDPSDFSHELALERNTNLRLKNVVSELVDKIKTLQNK